MKKKEDMEKALSLFDKLVTATEKEDVTFGNAIEAGFIYICHALVFGRSDRSDKEFREDVRQAKMQIESMANYFWQHKDDEDGIDVKKLLN